MRSRRLLVTIAVLGLLLIAQVWAQPPARLQPVPGRPSHGFQGYWMGVDPVDGGDARRSLLLLDNGKYSLAARDTVLTLCDGTDRGFASFEDGTVVDRNVMQSQTLTIQCFNNGASVTLHARYQLVGDSLMLEVATRPDGSPVSTIVFHKVSRN